MARPASAPRVERLEVRAYRVPTDGLPLVTLLGRARTRVPIYGSGGFTTYDLSTLERQLRGWMEAGIRSVKIKIGADPEDDPQRIWAAREAIGGLSDLRVDASGAFSTASALALSEVLADLGVSWFEEPVGAEDLDGLAWVRGRVPCGLRVAAGGYGHTEASFTRTLQARAVDVLQADATRCGGATGFLRAAALAHAFATPFSAHGAPALHAALGCAAEALESVEYFHDHVRVEALLFDGFAAAVRGLPRARSLAARAGAGAEGVRCGALPHLRARTASMTAASATAAASARRGCARDLRGRASGGGPAPRSGRRPLASRWDRGWVGRLDGARATRW